LLESKADIGNNPMTNENSRRNKVTKEGLDQRRVVSSPQRSKVLFCPWIIKDEAGGIFALLWK
jgi:hypothetical protein